MKRLRQLFHLSLLAGRMSWLAGCTVGPKYVRPNYPAPPAFRGADNAAVVERHQRIVSATSNGLLSIVTRNSKP